MNGRLFDSESGARGKTAASGDRIRRASHSGDFLPIFLLNLLMNPEWSLPAWILLGLHYFLDISIRWFFIALIIWFLRILFGMWLIGWAARCGSSKDPPKENKNPYSYKKEQ